MEVCDSKTNNNIPNNASSTINNNIINNNSNVGISDLKNSIINNNQTIQKMLPEKINEISFRCYYEIKDYNETQIITDKNEEIKLKVKILNGNNKEKLIFKKKFNKIGINIIDFIIEGKLNNMSLMFNDCSSLRKIEFISFETSQVTNMKGMFQECNELEYLDLSNFNTSNVIDMGCIFNQCHKLKQIIGLNKFNTSKVIIMRGMFQSCKEIE